MVSHLTLLEELIAHACRQGAGAADALLLQSADISVSRRLGKLEDMERAESTGVGLRVLVGQRQAAVSGSDLARESLRELAERAVAIAAQVPEDPHLGLADKFLLARETPDLRIEDPAEPKAEWLLERCAAAEEAALSVPGITNSEGASAHFSRHRVALATSTGFAREYGQTSASLSISVLAGEGTAMERDHDFAMVRFAGDLPEPGEIGREAARRALARLGARRVKTCEVPVVFDPRVGKSLLANFAGAISGAAVARGTSFLKDSLEKTVFSPAIQVIDDPLMIGGLASKPFDGEGAACGKLELVKEGVLRHWLLDCRSARQLGMQSNGRAGRGLSSAPSPAATNLYLAAGRQSPEELISDIESGFYVTETFGMGVNLITGDYSQGAAGFWIEKGRKAYPVSEVTIAGRLQEMFLQMTPASDLEFRYRVNSPTLRIEKMTVAGS